MTRCPFTFSVKSTATLSALDVLAGVTLALIAVTATGCAPSPSSNGTWTGYVERQTLRAGNSLYQAASLRVVDGPEIPTAVRDNQHGWLPSPILVDDDERIIDPAAFGGPGLVKVEGNASRMWEARTPDGRILDYEPPPAEMKWVNGAIRVRRAIGADGRAVRLYLAKPAPATAATNAVGGN